TPGRRAVLALAALALLVLVACVLAVGMRPRRVVAAVEPTRPLLTDEQAIELLPRAERAEAWERLGDACAGKDDARAERAFAAADEAGRRTSDVRAKRG